MSREDGHVAESAGDGAATSNAGGEGSDRPAQDAKSATAEPVPEPAVGVTACPSCAHMMRAGKGDEPSTCLPVLAYMSTIIALELDPYCRTNTTHTPLVHSQCPPSIYTLLYIARLQCSGAQSQ